jgi:hypothetical protein
MIKKLILLLSIVATSIYAKVTPSDVYPNAKAIKIAVAKLVNKNVGHGILPVVELDLKGTAPHHVYALASALHYKIKLYMDIKGMGGFEDITYPTSKLGPANVNDILAVIKNNISKIDSNVYQPQQKTSNDMTPANVMQEILYANLWMDKLFGGKIKPSFPYQVVSQIDHELDKIIKHNSLEYTDVEVSKYSSVTPLDVFLNGMIFYQMLSLYDTVNNKTNNPLKPYDILSAGVKVTPVDVFTLSQFIISYLLYVEQKMGITPNKEYINTIKFEQGKKPADVYMMYNKTIRKLSFIVTSIQGR